jgi:hypothetical protein
MPYVHTTSKLNLARAPLLDGAPESILASRCRSFSAGSTQETGLIGFPQAAICYAKLKRTT